MKLKICGMRDSANIVEVADLLPDYMGFIFYPQSPRFVGADFHMPEMPISIKKVGVFVNEEQETILEIVHKYKLDLVQLHGTESTEFCKALNKALSKISENRYRNIRLIKAFGVDNNMDFSILEQYSLFCDYFLFDTKTANYGGSGMKFDWTILERYKEQKPFFLCGGIDLESVVGIKHQLVNKYNIHAIDVNSKFEISPGLKDWNKLYLLKHELSG